MKITKKDLLRIREIAAEKGIELTPDQITGILNEATNTQTEIVNEPGLVTELQTYGDSSTSRPPIDTETS